MRNQNQYLLRFDRQSSPKNPTMVVITAKSDETVLHATSAATDCFRLDFGKNCKGNVEIRDVKNCTVNLTSHTRITILEHSRTRSFGCGLKSMIPRARAA